MLLRRCLRCFVRMNADTGIDKVMPLRELDRFSARLNRCAWNNDALNACIPSSLQHVIAIGLIILEEDVSMRIYVHLTLPVAARTPQRGGKILTSSLCCKKGDEEGEAFRILERPLEGEDKGATRSEVADEFDVLIVGHVVHVESDT